MAALGTGACLYPGQSVIASPVLAGNNEQPIIRLSSNENAYGPSPAALEAMARCIRDSNRYPWQKIPELTAAIAVKNKLATANVLIGAGSSQLIDAVIQLAALQKGSFVIADPTFSRWGSAAEKLGLQRIAVPLTIDKKHHLPAMLQAIQANTRLIYVCNPNNPTGTICDAGTLTAFIKEATRKAYVLLDEAYLEYANEPSLGHLVADNEKLIVLRTFSKIYGMAGARIGYALAHANTIDQLIAVQSGSNIGISTVSITGALAALKSDDFIKESYRLNEQVKTYTTTQLESMHIPCISSHTNFVYFSLINYPKDLFALLKAHHIEGTGIFEEAGKWSRITVGTLQEMQQFIAAIQ